MFATVLRSMFRVLGIYNFALCSVCTLYMSPFNMICHILTSSSHQSVICLNVIVYLESLFANRGNCSMVMFKRELASNDKIRVNNRGCSLYRMGCFIYILDSSNSSSITFWTSQFRSSSRSNWTGIWTGNSNGSWTDKQSSHFSTAKEMSVKATFFFM